MSADAGSSLQDPSTLLQLEGAQLKQVLLKTDGVMLVLITTHDCGEACERSKSTMAAAQEKAGDLISFAYMDARAPIINDDGVESVVAVEFNVTSVPALLLYTYGPKGVIPMQKIQPQVTAALLGSGLKQFLKTLRQFLPSAVQKVTSKGLKKFFTFDHPERQRVLLISKKKKEPLPLVRLSLQYATRAVVGFASPSDEDLMAKLGLDEDDVPALLVSPKGASPLDPAADKLEWTRYEGGNMAYPALSAWMHEAVAEVPIPLINDNAVFEQHCKEQGGVCFIAFLPEDSWEEALEVYKRVANRVYVTPNIIASKFTVEEMPMRFAWAQAELQGSIRSKLDVVASPGIVALNAKKGVYGPFTGSFAEQDAYEFIVDTMVKHKGLVEFDAKTLPYWRSTDRWATKASIAKRKKKGKKKKAGKKKKKKGGKKKKAGKKKDKSGETEAEL